MRDNSKPSRVERAILYNQHQILEKLDPGNADHHQRMMDALMDGYEREYPLSHIEDPVPDEILAEVVDILGMYDVLRISHKRLDDTAGAEADDIEFPGFDGNNETSHFGYARFLQKTRRFVDVGKSSDGLNSHMPLLAKYKKMLAKFKGMDRNENSLLSREQIEELVGTAAHD